MLIIYAKVKVSFCCFRGRLLFPHAYCLLPPARHCLVGGTVAVISISQFCYDFFAVCLLNLSAVIFS